MLKSVLSKDGTDFFFGGCQKTVQTFSLEENSHDNFRDP